MKIYIDFDGVILDTYNALFEKMKSDKTSEDNVIKHVASADWHYVLNNSPVINDSVHYLGLMDPTNSFILTKIHSLSEGVEKVKWLRKMGVKQSVILVPNECKKMEMVEAKDNVLVDDSLKNLSEWEESGGIPIFFDINDDNIDSWNEENTKGYERVRSFKRLVK